MLSDTLVARALEVAGLSYGAQRAAFLEFLQLSKNPARSNRAGASESCCGTTVRALLRDAGVDGRVTMRGQLVDVLGFAYDELPGDVFEQLETLAMGHRAWKGAHVLTLADLRAGLVVVFGGVAHMFTITGVADDGVTLETVEGGQPDAANGGLDTAIVKKTRTARVVGGRVWISDPMNRPIYGVFYVDDLPATTV